MNFLELCQRAFDEADNASYAIDTTRLDPDTTDEQIYKIVRWVKQAYEDIQSWNSFFDFLHVNGVILTTTADGTTDYAKTNIRAINWSSLKIRKASAPTSEWPMTWLAYRQFMDVFNIGQYQDSAPQWITQLPNKQLRVWPGPDAVYEVLGDYYIKRDTFEVDEDEPLFEEDYHMLIVWVALQYYTTEYETPEYLKDRIILGMKTLRPAFLDRYTPVLTLGEAFA